MSIPKSAAWIFAVVFAAVFVYWVPASANTMTTSTTPVALQARSGQAFESAPARVLRADWDRGDRDFHRWRGGDDWGDDDGGGFYFGGAPYYGYQPYYHPYYYQRQPFGLWFNF